LSVTSTGTFTVSFVPSGYVEVTDNRSDADKYEPTVEGEKVEIGGKVDLTDNVPPISTFSPSTVGSYLSASERLSVTSTGTFTVSFVPTITDVTPGGTIDTNTPGNYEGVIEVTYPDGTKDTVS
jgi:hypothetical protein